MINKILMAAILAWTLSQVAKVLYGLYRYGRKDVALVSWRLIWAGGMPSSHSAFTVATALMSGLQAGFESVEFAIATVVATVVIYDRSRMHHIYSVFRHRFPALDAEVAGDSMLTDLVGHTVGQVIAGIIIGAISTAVVFVAVS
jgi:uncharacterized protein